MAGLLLSLSLEDEMSPHTHSSDRWRSALPRRQSLLAREQNVRVVVVGDDDGRPGPADAQGQPRQGGIGSKKTREDAPCPCARRSSKRTGRRIASCRLVRLRALLRVRACAVRQK